MKKLKNNHPLMIKINKLIDFMEELGITIHGMNSTQMRIQDHDAENIYYYLNDLESESAVENFPPTFEFKIIYNEEESKN